MFEALPVVQWHSTNWVDSALKMVNLQKELARVTGQLALAQGNARGEGGDGKCGARAAERGDGDRGSKIAEPEQ